MRQPPVPITDVVRAALGEVEDYQQVDARDVEPTTMLGVVAADLAHLIAELVENALVFSPEHQPVAVHGRTWPAGGTARPSDAGGHGHAPDAIEAANRRLAGVESFTVAPSMYLGHYVAGNLAARHGIHVYVMPSPQDPSLLAGIDMTPDLVVHDAPAAALPDPWYGREAIAPSATMGRPITGV